MGRIGILRYGNPINSKSKEKKPDLEKILDLLKEQLVLAMNILQKIMGSN